MIKTRTVKMKLTKQEFLEKLGYDHANVLNVECYISTRSTDPGKIIINITEVGSKI